MPTLGYLVDERSELQLRFLERAIESYRETKVSLLAVAGEEELLRGRINVAQPPGAMLLLRTPGGLNSALVAALDRLLPVLAKYRASGVVITVAEHSDLTVPPATRAAAAKLRIPLLTTTANSATWDGLHEGIRYCRVEYAERQVEKLTGLVSHLPAQWADATALESITDWLATALDAQVLISEPGRGVLAAAPDTAMEQLAHLATAQGMEPGPIQAHVDTVGVHTRLVSLAPSGFGNAVLAVAADRPFDDADTRLITHAAKVLGLVEQARRDYATVTQTAREARAFTYQLLMAGESVTARRFMAGFLNDHSFLNQARVYLIECGSAQQREATLRRCEMATTGRAIVVRCPEEEQRLVVVEPLSGHKASDYGIAPELQRLVMSLGGGHRLGGSSDRPLGKVAAAYQDALAALRFGQHRQEPYVLTTGDTTVLDLLEPGPARAWGQRIIAPIRRGLPADKAAQIEETLPVALGHPHTKAARRLGVHRNTVAYRVHRASELLQLDLGRTANKVVVGLAMELAALPAMDPGGVDAGAELEDLLATQRVHAWASALADPIRDDRRDLARTLTTWLDQDESVEKTAGSLCVAEATVRSHLKTIEGLTGRRLTTLPGLRDITIALAVCTGTPIRTAGFLTAA